jgi:hypothetical protein
VERKEEDIKTQRHEEGIYFEAQRHKGTKENKLRNRMKMNLTKTKN